MFAAGDLPFLVDKPGPASQALDAWYRQYAEREMKDVKVCLAHLHVGTLHSQDADHRAGPDQGHEDPPGQRHRGADGRRCWAAPACRSRRPKRATR